MFHHKLRVKVKLRGLPESISPVSGNDAVQKFLKGVFIWVGSPKTHRSVPQEITSIWVSYPSGFNKRSRTSRGYIFKNLLHGIGSCHCGAN